MKSKGQITQERILATTLDLIESQGFHHTGLQQIIKLSGTPKGSIYFHFPDGKDQIAALALQQGAEQIELLLVDAFRSKSIKQAIEQIIGALTDRLLTSNFTKGCPIATVALEVSEDHPAVRSACEQAYQRWLVIMSKRLRTEGMSPVAAEKEATLLLAMIEGGLLLAKVQRSATPLKLIAKAAKERFDN